MWWFISFGCSLAAELCFFIVFAYGMADRSLDAVEKVQSNAAGIAFIVFALGSAISLAVAIGHLL